VTPNGETEGNYRTFCGSQFHANLCEGEGSYNSDCGDNDCHYLVVDTVNNKLYENYGTTVNTFSHTIQGACAVVWDLCREYPDNLRGDQCTRYLNLKFSGFVII
jgi:hypothetical protein